MKNILPLAMLLASCAATAQETVQYPHARHYQVGEQVYYDISRAIPGSTMQFYSHTGGGKLLMQQLVTPQGSLHLKAPQGFAPAMLVNNGNGGNHAVVYFGEKAFVLKNMEATTYGETTLISCNATIPQYEDYSIELLQSPDGIHYTTAQVQPVLPGELAAYKYNAPTQPGTHYYKIRLIHTADNDTYTTHAMQVSGTPIATIYPTAATGTVQINTPEEGTYTIHSQTGTQVAQGVLRHGSNTIELGGLTPATYTITIHSQSHKISVQKLVKL